MFSLVYYDLIWNLWFGQNGQDKWAGELCICTWVTQESCVCVSVHFLLLGSCFVLVVAEESGIVVSSYCCGVN